MMAPFQSPKAADSSATSSSSASSSSLCQLEPTSSSASSPPSSSPTKSKPENERNDLAPTSIHSKLSHSDSNLFDRFCSSLNLISKKKSLTLDNRLTKKTNKCSDFKLISSSSTSLSLKKPKIQQQKLFDENQGCVGGSSDNSNLIEDVKPIDTTSQVLKTSLSETCLKQDSLMSSVEKLNKSDEQKQQPQSHKSRPNRSKSSSPKSASLSWLSFINCCITRTDSLSDIGKVRTAETTTTTTNLKNGAKCSKPSSSSSSSSCLSQTLSKKPQINNNGRIPMKLFVNYDLPCSSSSSSSQFSDIALSSDSSSLPPVNCSSSNQLISSNLNNNNNSSDTAIAGSSSASVIITGSRSISSQTFCSTPSSSSRNGSGSGSSVVPHQPFRRRIHHNDNGDEQLLDPTVDIQVDDIHYQQYEQEQQQQLQRRRQLRASNEQNNDDDGGDGDDELMPLADIEEDFQKFLLQFNAFRNGSNDDGDDNGFHNINSQLHFQQPSGMAEIITGHHYPYRILNSNVTNPSQVNNSQQSSSSSTTTAAAAAGNSDGNMPKNFAELDRQSDQLLKRYKNPIHTQIDYVNCLVPDLMAISNCSFYWGKMDRYEAERLLENKPEGTFLLRDSAQEDHLFSVSFRRFDRSLHARIEQWKHRFSFDSHDPGVFSSTTVTGLIEHYKDPSHCMFFEPMLTRPLNRTEPFSLQHLARVTISDRCTYETVNQLPIPIVLKCYLKEYHYRQKVRTKHFDEITYLDDFFYN